MKLRIEQQTVRFRLSPQDLASLADGGRLIETLKITPSAVWGYAIEASKDVPEPRVLAESQNFKVLFPDDRLRAWIDSHEIELEFHSGGLDVLIEKDLKPNR